MPRFVPFLILGLASCEANPPSWATAPVPTGSGRLVITATTRVVAQVVVGQFGVTIDSQAPRPIPANGSITVDPIDSGDHYVRLETGGATCFVSSVDGLLKGSIVKVSVGAGATAQVRFDVTCIP